MTLAVYKVDGHGFSNTAHHAHLAKKKVETVLAIERKNKIYQALATRWSTTVIKTSL